MPSQNGGRPPPRDAGSDPPIERLGRRLDNTKFNGNAAQSQGGGLIPRERLARLARKIHRLGERPLFELFRELATGANLHECLERYAALAPLTGLIQSLSGDRLPRPGVIRGRRA
jgi:hypothetical protein